MPPDYQNDMSRHGTHSGLAANSVVVNSSSALVVHFIEGMYYAHFGVADFCFVTFQPNYQAHDASALGSRHRPTAIGVRRDKAALFQWVQAPPGNRSSRKQPEQLWR
jgi:hypothetical protein